MKPELGLPVQPWALFLGSLKESRSARAQDLWKSEGKEWRQCLQDDRVDILVGLLPGFWNQEPEESLCHDGLHVVEACAAPCWIEAFTVRDLIMELRKGGGTAGEQTGCVVGDNAVPGGYHLTDIVGQLVLCFHGALSTV